MFKSICVTQQTTRNVNLKKFASIFAICLYSITKIKELKNQFYSCSYPLTI